MASKSFKEPRVTKMRYAQEEKVMYEELNYLGKVCYVLCNDNVIRLCIIRKKFRGRNKRDNNCGIDSMVILIARMGGYCCKKKPKVDLIYTYDKSQMEELKMQRI